MTVGSLKVLVLKLVSGAKLAHAAAPKVDGAGSLFAPRTELRQELHNNQDDNNDG